jgi:hypothetical protein
MLSTLQSNGERMTDIILLVSSSTQNEPSIYQCSNQASVFDIDIHSIENLGLRLATRLYHFFGKAMAKVTFFLDLFFHMSVLCKCIDISQALYEKHILYAPLARYIWKQLCGSPPALPDLRQVRLPYSKSFIKPPYTIIPLLQLDPELFRGLKWMMMNDITGIDMGAFTMVG